MLSVNILACPHSTFWLSTKKSLDNYLSNDYSCRVFCALRHALLVLISDGGARPRRRDLRQNHLTRPCGLPGRSKQNHPELILGIRILPVEFINCSHMPRGFPPATLLPGGKDWRLLLGRFAALIERATLIILPLQWKHPLSIPRGRSWFPHSH